MLQAGPKPFRRLGEGSGAKGILASIPAAGHRQDFGADFESLLLGICQPPHPRHKYLIHN
jgi:hypothetical protein